MTGGPTFRSAWGDEEPTKADFPPHVPAPAKPLPEPRHGTNEAKSFGAAIGEALEQAKGPVKSWEKFSDELGMPDSLLRRFRRGTGFSIRKADDLCAKLGWTVRVER